MNIASTSSPANGDITATKMMDYAGGSGNKNEMNAPETAAINDDGFTGDDEEHEAMEFRYKKTGTHQFVPTIAEADRKPGTFGDIKKILNPPCKKGTGYDHHGLLTDTTDTHIGLNISCTFITFTKV